MAQCPDCNAPDVGAALSLQSKGDGKCASCYGDGTSHEVLDQTVAVFSDDPGACRDCGGTGKCSTCGGSGVVDGDDDDEEGNSEDDDE